MSLIFFLFRVGVGGGGEAKLEGVSWEGTNAREGGKAGRGERNFALRGRTGQTNCVTEVSIVGLGRENRTRMCGGEENICSEGRRARRAREDGTTLW